jgi:hypothetical protein
VPPQEVAAASSDLQGLVVPAVLPAIRLQPAQVGREAELPQQMIHRLPSGIT